MPCQDCGRGEWECGPEGARLCMMAAMDLRRVGEVCHDVYVYKDDAGKCQASIDEPPTGDEGCPPPRCEKYTFCVEIGVRELEGDCVVRYKFEPQ